MDCKKCDGKSVFRLRTLTSWGATRAAIKSVVKRPNLSIGKVESAVYDPLPEIHYTDYTQFADEPSSFTQCLPGCRCRCNESRTETQQVPLSVRLSFSRVPPDEIFAQTPFDGKAHKAQSYFVSTFQKHVFFYFAGKL